MRFYLMLLAGLAVVTPACHHSAGDKYTSWPAYGGSKDNIHYSALRQIDTSNAGSLRQAWEYHTGDADSNSQIQVNSLVIDGTLYGVSPRLKLFALDAATGRMKWVYDTA